MKIKFLFLYLIFRLKNKKGFSLVGVLVASGVGLIVMTGITQMFANIFSQLEQIENRLDLNIYKSFLAESLREEETCKSTLEVHIEKLKKGASGQHKFSAIKIPKISENSGDENTETIVDLDTIKSQYGLEDPTFQLECKENCNDCSVSGTEFPCKTGRWEVSLISHRVVSEGQKILNPPKLLAFYNIEFTEDNKFNCGSILQVFAPKASYIYAMHSQTGTPPDCPDGFDSLWTGYSLLGASSSGSRQFHLDDALGGPGSCVNKFNRIVYTECSDERGLCDNWTPHDATSWLHNLTHLEYYPGRVVPGKCRVCKGSKIWLVRHSQTTRVPEPPVTGNWKKLWEGYSFYGANDGASSSSGLSSPGSCLRRFTLSPFFRCYSDWSNVGCYTRSKWSAWLSTFDSDAYPVSRQQIGRCAVFMEQ